ncbi:DUF1275 domain-containing protein [Xylanimonas oleitrophica]|uniref:DUF1275 domain-containing protein n=2 Tax=Xylanimonas oleitrophica TaxID=2607479 RepID=A0A2W5WSW1_9MICO|nr:DUF1275 domain-containing protein [Xylanimonas oleitrophica]
MLALTFSTGIADAVGYLGLDRVFTGNMTGNVVILGMGIAGADDLPVTGPLVALAAFMLGAAVAGRVLRGTAAGWSARTTALLAAVAVAHALVALALVLADPTAATSGPGETDSGYLRSVEVALAAGLALAMGAQAAAARHVAVKDVTTVVVTSTITGLAADSWLGRGVGQPWARRALAVLLIGAGAAAGALLLQLHLAWGVALSALITAVVAVLGHGSEDRPA